AHQKSPMLAAKLERDFGSREKMRYGGFISEWLVLGPIQIPEELIPIEDERPPERNIQSSPQTEEQAETQEESLLKPLVERDFLEGVGGEANVRPSPGDYLEQNGRMLTWEHHDLSHARGTLDGLPGFDVKSGLAYLATYFKSAKSGTFNMELGREYNNTIAVWMNGERVWHKGERKDTDSGDSQGEDWNLTPVKVSKGWNAVLVKTAKISRGGESPRPGQKEEPRDKRDGWRLFTRWHGMEIIDSKTAWNSHGEINTADGFNVVLADEKSEFALTADILGIEKTNPIVGIDILLPEPLRNSDAKVGSRNLVGDIKFGDQQISASSTFADGLLKIRWTEKISSDDTISVKFETTVSPADQELDFGVKLVSEDGSVVQELEDGNSDEHPKNSNGFSGITILVDKSDVPAPTDVKAEPVFGENDVIVRWSKSEDPRVNGYEILADGESIELIHGANQTEWTHHNLTPKSTIAYTVKAIVVPELKSPPSEVVTAHVGTDTTDPIPPMEVKEAIPLGEESTTKPGKLISWEPSFSKDVVSYEILRRAPDSDMVKIATVPADTTEYLDMDAPELDLYQVRAVDEAGNNAVAELNLVSDWRDFYRRRQEYRERREMDKYFAMMKRFIQNESESGNQWREWDVDWLQQQLVDVFAEQKELDLLTPIYEAAIESSPEDIGNYN
ncbi:fibronectin type III domain-containing protein, partial [bacterium]|nr:fibronectin type III domain-containing protein [bacterium]